MPLLVIEGLTGAGKSSVLTALSEGLQARNASCSIIYEEETFGELMDELNQPEPPADLLWRLNAVLAGLSALTSDWVILERFHLSYYALLPEWERYRVIDQQLVSLSARLVLLSYPPEMVSERALYRHEREGWSEGYIALYGSEQAALEALQTSLIQREQAFNLSQLPKLRLDTSAADWKQTAVELMRWVQISV